MRSGALVIGLLALGASGVRADDAALRAEVTGAVDAQLAVVDRTRATVDGKLAALADQRVRRVRAAYKLLRAGSAPAWVEPHERMATARRRAAVRWLVARDRREEALLADEAAALAAAGRHLLADRATAATATLPPADLDRPVRGTIFRHVGTFSHERSKAILTRRGLDYEVDDDAEVHPVADGIVVYAGPIRGLDHGVVIDHGGWWSVLGKLDPPAVAAGDRVVRGQVIARPEHHRIYLEVRVRVGAGGVPIDPELLFGRRDD